MAVCATGVLLLTWHHRLPSPKRYPQRLPDPPMPRTPAQVTKASDLIHVLAFINRRVSISPRPSVEVTGELKSKRSSSRTTMSFAETIRACPGPTHAVI